MLGRCDQGEGDLKAGVNIQSLTPSQRSKYVTPVRTDLANFHKIVTPDDMSSAGMRYEFHRNETFRKEMKKWGPAHSSTY